MSTLSATDKTVHMHPVTVAQIDGGQALIDEGLWRQQKVVVAGQYGLLPGAHVKNCTASAAGAGTAERSGAGDPMNISAPFIERPIATILLMIGLAAVRDRGLSPAAGRRAAERQLPDHSGDGAIAGRRPADHGVVGGDAARAAVLANPGSDPAHVIERARLHPAYRYSSTSSRDVDSAAEDVLAAINAASPYLPLNMPYPPTIRKVNPADTPIMVLGLTSDTLPLTTVDAYAENILVPKISQIPGVGLVGIGGQQKPAIRVQVDPQALANRGISLEDVRTVLGASQCRSAERHAQQPAADLHAQHQRSSCSSRTPMTNLIVAYRNGSPVRIRDIGQAI